MTAREFAKAINKPYPTVALWLRQNRISGAYQEKIGDFSLWQVPVEAVKQFEPPKQGRPKKAAEEAETLEPETKGTAKPNAKKTAKKASNSAVKTKPAAKKRTSKKGN